MSTNASAAPQVESLLINQGGETRSMIDRLDINFDQPVVFDTTHGDPFTLVNVDDNQFVDVPWSSTLVSGKTKQRCQESLIGGNCCDRLRTCPDPSELTRPAVFIMP